MRFALLTDSHFGPAPYFSSKHRIMSEFAPRLLGDCVEEINKYYRPDFVVHLGDLIQESRVEACVIADDDNRARAQEILSHLDMPLFHCIGNHDCATRSQIEVARQYGNDAEFYAVDFGAYRGLFLSWERSNGGALRLPLEQLAWLAEELEEARQDILLFSHYPLIDLDLSGNFWFEHRIGDALLENREMVQHTITAAVRRRGVRVRAAFNGHLHWSRMEMRSGVPFFGIESLVENFRLDGTPSAAFAVVDCSASDISVDVRGNNRAFFEWSAAQAVPTRAII